MKKTIIALLALGGIAMGETDLPTYDLQVINGTNGENKVDTPTEAGNFWFGENITLTSWMIDFEVSALVDGPANKFFTLKSGDNSVDYGSWGGSALSYRTSCFYYGGQKTVVPVSNPVQFKVGETIRIAYDASENMVYLYNATTDSAVGTEDMTPAGSNFSLVSGADSFKAAGSYIGKTTYGNVVDMSSIAGTDAFLTYVKTGKMPDTPAIPEPTTATLSLLALAGLAARRRRK